MKASPSLSSQLLVPSPQPLIHPAFSPSEKLNARIQVFGYNARAFRSPRLEKPEKIRRAPKHAGGTAVAESDFLRQSGFLRQRSFRHPFSALLEVPCRGSGVVAACVERRGAKGSGPSFAAAPYLQSEASPSSFRVNRQNPNTRFARRTAPRLRTPLLSQ